MASASPAHDSTSPPLGSSEPGITSTAQGMLRCYDVAETWSDADVDRCRAVATPETSYTLRSSFGTGEGAGRNSEMLFNTLLEIGKD